MWVNGRKKKCPSLFRRQHFACDKKSRVWPLNRLSCSALSVCGEGYAGSCVLQGGFKCHFLSIMKEAGALGTPLCPHKTFIFSTLSAIPLMKHLPRLEQNGLLLFTRQPPASPPPTYTLSVNNIYYRYHHTPDLYNAIELGEKLMGKKKKYVNKNR